MPSRFSHKKFTAHQRADSISHAKRYALTKEFLHLKVVTVYLKTGLNQEQVFHPFYQEQFSQND